MLTWEIADHSTLPEKLYWGIIHLKDAPEKVRVY